MTDMILLQRLSIDDDIFAPVPVNSIAKLLQDYTTQRAEIYEVAGILEGKYRNVIEYFMEANTRMWVTNLFDAEKAIKKLNAASWQKALILTDIYNVMPQKRRSEWDKQIEDLLTPDFYEETVIPTLESLLKMRPQFLAERVEGIFNALSREHLTNLPEGFGKRMIVANVSDKYMFANSRQCGYINDLRCVIAKLMGRDEPNYGQTQSLITSLYKEGKIREWFDVDGGALRIRVYLKGTAHLEIHPDIAWRLNSILAHLHPMAIPSEMRTKPKRKKKSVTLVENLIPFKVLNLLSGLYPRKDNTYSIGYSWSNADKHLIESAQQVLKALGGVYDNQKFKFDYDVEPILKKIMMTGSIPNQKSYQYYPTPIDIASRAVLWADIEDSHTCLEPSAGQGGIADLMPLAQTTCVEVSSLHCEILRSKGFEVVEADFIEWSKSAPKYDRIVMNPPFSVGRWKEHVEAAANLLEDEGILVAILPSSARTLYLEGFDMEWSENISGASFGVSIDLVIMKGKKI